MIVGDLEASEFGIKITGCPLCVGLFPTSVKCFLFFFPQMFIYPFWTKVRSIWRGEGRQPPIKCLTVIEVKNKVQLFMNMYTSYTFYVISVNTDIDTFRHRTFIKFTYKLFTEVLTTFDMDALQQFYQV